MAQNYYLMHHGIKGMKWGVRKTPEQLGYTRSAQGSPATKAAVGRSTNIAKRLSASSGHSLVNKMNDPEFRRRVAKGAKVALAVGALYAGHKIINDPKILQAGKNLTSNVLAKSGKIKTSAMNSVMKSTEFKAAKTLIDAVKSTDYSTAKTAANKARNILKKIGSEDFRNTIIGIGAMAGTVGAIRGQMKDLKENRGDGDAFDRAVRDTQRLSEIGENINTLARGPKGASSSSKSSDNKSSDNKSSDNKSVGKEVTDRIGAPSNKGIDKQSKAYQDLFKGQDSDTRSTIKSLANNGYDIDQIKKYLNHSAIPIGWHFNRAAKNYYIF